MTLPEPLTVTFSGLIGDIEKGLIKIPQFQRDFVWDIEKSANLIDSIIKGYPIGTFIFWKTKERLRSIRNIGGIGLPNPENGDFVNFVLDGQQRLTSLFASLRGAQINQEHLTVDYSNIFINLEALDDEQIVVCDVQNLTEGQYIKLTDLIYGGLAHLSQYDLKYHTKLDEYKNRIGSYLFSIITLKDASLDVATEVFTRINVSGQPLSLFEIMVAKTFDAEKDFDLSEKFNNFIDSIRPLNYDTIPDITVLQTISILLSKECTRKQILKLDKNKFIACWDKGIDAIERAIEYFRNSYRIPVSHLLPYNALIVPFAYFFYQHPEKPIGNMQQYLQDYFWRCALSGRFSSSVETKLAQDIKKIDLIINNQLPTYDWVIDISTQYIESQGWFSVSRSYIKSLLCILAYHQPKSFNDNSIVRISNDWLKQANSKNYHHFFPKAYLSKHGVEDFYANHIANITIVDDYLNKRVIGAKAPSQYMRTFAKHNECLSETMKTHLIVNLDKFGIWTNDYFAFFKARITVFHKELKKRICTTDNVIINQE